MTVIGVTSAVFAGILYVPYILTGLSDHHEGECLTSSLHIHRRNAKLDSDRRSLLRSLEVGSAISLFILWPRKFSNSLHDQKCQEKADRQWRQYPSHSSPQSPIEHATTQHHPSSTQQMMLSHQKIQLAYYHLR